MGLLDMSLAGGVLILAVTVIRALTVDRLPKATFTVLWAVAVLRLLAPVSVSSAVSVYTWLTPRETAAVEETAAPTPAPAPTAAMPATAAVPAVSAQNTTAADAAGAPDPVRSAPDIPWREVVWAGGAALCGAYFAACWLAGRRRFREAVEVEDDFVRRWQERQTLRRRVSVRLSGRVDAPVTYGLIRPVVLLPASTDWRDRDRLEFILAHEYVHIRRMDGLKKLVLTGAVCLHWFNPAVWVMYILANRDMELACDERVVRSMGGDVRAAYARTLIDMAQVRMTAAPVFSWFSANAMEERITSIMKTKRLTAWAVVMSLVLTLGVTAVFGTSAQAAETADEPVPYDWGEAQVLLPLTEETLDVFFPEDDIEWWTAEDFAAWTEEQKPLLEAAVGSRSDSAAVMGIWTEERSEKLLAAYEGIVMSLENGGKLSRSVNGDPRVVVAVGMDWADAVIWPIEDDWACAQDVEALVWDVTDGSDGADGSEPWEPVIQLCVTPAGTVRFGPSQTVLGLMKTMKAFFENRVAAGFVTLERAENTYEAVWQMYQGGQMPEVWQIYQDGQMPENVAIREEAAEPNATPDPIPAEASEASANAEPEATPIPAETQRYADEKPQYVWDLTSGSGMVYEANPAAEADYLLDIQPYGFRTPVNIDYVSGVQSFNALLQPGATAIVGQSEGTYETLVFFHDDGQVAMGQLSLDGKEENLLGGVLDVQAGSFNTGYNGWTVDGGTEFYVRNTGDTPIHIDAFMYETK